MNCLLSAAIAFVLATPAAAAPVFGVRTDLPGPVNPCDVVIADMNDDGALDVLVAAPGSPPSQGVIVTWFGRGDGYFWVGPSSPCLKAPKNLTVGRFDGDPYPDLALTSVLNFPSNGAIQVLRGQGDGSFVQDVLLTASPFEHYFFGLAAADLDGDGKTDLAASHSCTMDESAYAPAYVYMGNGDGSFVAPRVLGGYPASGTDVAIGDLNNDGTPDLSLATNDASRAFFLHAPGDDWVPSEGVQGQNQVRLGQFDNDGLLDQALSWFSPARVTIRLSGGSSYDIVLPIAPQSLAVADLDQDARTSSRAASSSFPRNEQGPGGNAPGPGAPRSL